MNFLKKNNSMNEKLMNKQLRENLKLSLIIDNQWLIPLYSKVFEDFFLERYDFEFKGATSLEPKLIKKEFKKQTGKYTDWHLTQYFNYISGRYLSIKLDNSMKNLFNLLKSDDKVNFELGFMVFNSLFKK